MKRARRSWTGLITFCLLMSMVALMACEAVIAAAVQDAIDLHEAGRNLVRENHDLRRLVRSECLDILRIETDKLKTDGEYDQARQRWRDNYPALVLPGAIKSKGESLDQPFGCE